MLNGFRILSRAHLNFRFFFFMGMDRLFFMLFRLMGGYLVELWVKLFISSLEPGSMLLLVLLVVLSFLTVCLGKC